MMYEVMVTINNSPTKVRKWGYLINADSSENAIIEALNNAKIKASKKWSRYKKCTFTVTQEDCKERPDW